MNTIVYPSKVFGSIKTVSSKSLAHRALICAALSSSVSKIYNVDLNDDISKTIEGLNNLGANISIYEDYIEVIGFDIFDKISNVSIDALESGSTLRFLIPLVSIKSSNSAFYGRSSLFKRPLSIYEDIFKKYDLEYKKTSNSLFISGEIIADNYEIVGNVSSQFISGLLFVLPLLKNDSTITIIEPFESKSYVDLTISVLKAFNIDIEYKDNTYFIKGNQKYKSVDYYVESDYSQVAFFAALAAINNDLEITNLNLNSIQGDIKILEFLEKSNVKIDYFKDSIKVYKSDIKSNTFDLNDTPDLGPILCVLGLFSDEFIKLENVKRLRLKESDRLYAMKTELEKFNAKVILEDNSITVFRLEDFIKVESVYGHNDHRIVMALSVLASTLKYPLLIKGSEAISKSYPRFFNDLESLNIKVKHYK